MKTPQLPYPKLSEALGLTNEVWFKREDLHHYGSHKGRSIPLMINEYKKQGIANFVISSSGNAALAAILAIQKYNQNAKGTPLKLTVLVGNKISPDKLRALQAPSSKLQAITIEQCERPKQQAFQIEKSGKAKWLRQSTDDIALLGYEELALELSKITNLAAVFIPTSSGTTAVGLHQGFKKRNINPEIHIVQTDSCHPMVGNAVIASEERAKQPPNSQNQVNPENNGIAASARTSPPRNDTRSLASAIVDNIALRKEQVLETIKNSHGGAYIANNDEITSAIKMTKEATGIDISANSALSIVGLVQAVKTGKKWNGAVVCLITGK